MLTRKLPVRFLLILTITILLGSMMALPIPDLTDGLWAKIAPEVEAVNTSTTIDGIRVSQYDGGIERVQVDGYYAEIDPSAEFVAVPFSESGPGNQSTIFQFAQNSGAQIAINTNMNADAYFEEPGCYPDSFNNESCDRTVGCHGLCGNSESIGYRPARNARFAAFVIHDNGDFPEDGPFTSEDINTYRFIGRDTNGDGLIVVSSNNRFAQIYIENIRSQPQARALETALQGKNVEAIVTGNLLMAANGTYSQRPFVLNNTQNLYSGMFDGSSRTFIGWKPESDTDPNAGKIVFFTLASGTLNTMNDAAESIGITDAIALDGGGSTQMFYGAGFNTIPGNENHSVTTLNTSSQVTNGPETDSQSLQQLYWPAYGRSENGPRPRAHFIGAIGGTFTESENDNSSNDGDSETPVGNDNTSQYGTNLKDSWTFECYPQDGNLSVFDHNAAIQPAGDSSNELTGPGFKSAFRAAGVGNGFQCENNIEGVPLEDVGCLAWAKQACGSFGVKTFCGVQLSESPIEEQQNELCPAYEIDFETDPPITLPQEDQIEQEGLTFGDVININNSFAEIALNSTNEFTQIPRDREYVCPVISIDPSRDIDSEINSSRQSQGTDKIIFDEDDQFNFNDETGRESYANFQIRQLRDGGYSHNGSPDIRCQNATDIYQIQSNGNARGIYEDKSFIISATDGVVTEIITPNIASTDCGGPYYDGGLTVKIADGYGNVHQYTHLDDDVLRNGIIPGRRVFKGQLLGTVYDKKLEEVVSINNEDAVDLSEFDSFDENDEIISRPASQSCYGGQHLHYAILSANSVDNYGKNNIANSNGMILRECAFQQPELSYPDSLPSDPISLCTSHKDNSLEYEGQISVLSDYNPVSIGNRCVTEDSVPDICRATTDILGIDTDNSVGEELDRLQNEVSAQSNLTNKISESGDYFIEVDEQILERRFILDESQNEAQIVFFRDLNGNQLRDENEEELIPDRIQLKVGAEEVQYGYELSAGWNLINLPFTNPEYTTASGILAELKQAGANPIHLAKFSNAKFTLFSSRSDTPGGFETNDFEIVPGEGIFVFVLAGEQVFLAGRPILDPVKLELSNGWNLIGVISPNTDYTSESLLNRFLTDEIDVSALSKYENGTYQSIVYDDSTLFGNNFNIVDKQGYFVRVEDGAKDFTP